MNYILFDDKTWNNLLPLTYTRPVCEIRTGILTIKEKWEKFLENKISYLTQEYLQGKYKLYSTQDNFLINASVFPNNELIGYIHKLKENEALINENKLIAVRLGKEDLAKFNSQIKEDYRTIEYTGCFNHVNWPWDLFKQNEVNIQSDFELLTKNRDSEQPDSSNQILNKNNIFIEQGAKIQFATLNASTGPIYIGKDTEIMEGTVIRGPFALCNNSTIKMSAKIYGPTTIGPHCKVGGEVNNSVFFGYSNKAHDGFLGNSVIGEWCNLGADTNSSNLKNNYAEVRLWNYENERFVKTGLQFCGLIMGDHSKCAINTMFNTGTVVGVSSNIFGEGFPRNFIPSFSWGGASGFAVYGINKALEVAEIVMERRGLQLQENDKDILKEIFKTSSKYRSF